MNTYANLFESICRVCVSQTNNESTMMPLLEKSSADGLSIYGKSVINFANITLQQGDMLPSRMCRNCLKMLKQAIRFKLMCESSFRKLNNIVKFSADNQNSNSLKECIVQYAMYNQCFPPVQPERTILYARIASFENDKLSVKQNTGLDKNSMKNAKCKTENDECNTITYKYKTQNYKSNECNKKNENVYVELVHDNFDMLDSPESISFENMFFDNIEQISSNTEMMKTSVKTGQKKRKILKKLKKITTTTVKRHKVAKKIEKKVCVCDVCKKTLTNIYSYNQHMLRHNGSSRYICEQCGKGFPYNSELQIHQVARHGTGRYLQCQHCNYKAPRKFDLIEHQRIHTGERPYACDKCGLTFRRRGLWKKHLIYHSEKNIQCPQCPRKFHQRSDLLAHANNVHERVYVYMCNICKITYAKTATVRRHLTERHDIPRAMQGKIIRIDKGKSIDFPDQYIEKI